MPYTIYNFTCKSKELRGAGSPNIIRVGLLSDADAETYKANIEALFSVVVVSVDKVLSSDYTLPYPAGTDWQARCAMWDESGQEEQLRVRNVKTTFNPQAFSADLIAAGILISAGGAFTPPDHINAYVIKPGRAF